MYIFEDDDDIVIIKVLDYQRRFTIFLVQPIVTQLYYILFNQ